MQLHRALTIWYKCINTWNEQEKTWYGKNKDDRVQVLHTESIISVYKSFVLLYFVKLD